jgi:IMP dehydrogenase
MPTIRNENGLTFDDVLLVPGASNILPDEVNLSTKLTSGISLHMPLLSAAMDTVTESRLAIALAQEGGLGVIHKNMSIEQQALEVRAVKKFESGIIHDPVCVAPDTTVAELLTITKAHNFSGVPVVSNENLLGIITNRDVRFVTDLDQPVSQVMTKKERLVTVKEGESREVLLELFREHRIEKLLMVDDDFNLRGMITVKDILQAVEKPWASKDDLGRLLVGAAVGVGADGMDRVKALVAEGVDVVIVDTAHGHHKSVIDQVRLVKETFPDLQVIAGNIATGAAANDLVKAGADAVKVGMGPGSICTTRIIAGIGMPQITAIMDVCQALQGTNIPVIADGGLRYSGDVAKALAAGATTVMIGSLFAGTDESPGEIELFQGRAYKSYRGMGSMGAMMQKHGSSDRYFQAFENKRNKLVPEGIEGRVPHKGPLKAICDLITGGVRASMGYLGCENIATLHERAEFVRVTQSGVRESHVHDVMITKEAPNYQSDQQ